MSQSIGMVSLGCAKNQVDAEQMLFLLQQAGYNILPEPAGADVVMGLRIQLERQKQGLFPSLREYNSLWGIDEELLSLAGPDAVVMHPGPVNRGVEIGSGVLDGEKSLVLEQVTNGVAVRMAVLSLIGKELQEV